MQKTLYQLCSLECSAHGQGTEHYHKQDAKYVLDDENGQYAGSKRLVAEAKVVVGFVDDSGGTHAQHTAQKDAVHAAPAEQRCHHTPDAYHAEHHHHGRQDRLHTHAHYLLEGELQAQREHKENDTQVTPLLDALYAAHRRRVGHVRTCKEACHDIAQNKRLLESLENDSHYTCYDKYIGKVGDKWGQLISTF